MVPCYIDMFYPQVGKSTLGLLEKLGVQVDYPFDQTCCGQPMANSGAHTEAKATEELFVRNFADFDYVVAPSGSCVHHIALTPPKRRRTHQRITEVAMTTGDVPQMLDLSIGINASGTRRETDSMGAIDGLRFS